MLGGAFTVFRKNARVLLLWSLLLSGVLGLLSTLVSTFGQQALQSRMTSAIDSGGDGSGSDSILAGSFTLWIVLSVLLPFLAFLGRGFLVAPVAADTGQRVLGRRATFRGIWTLLGGRRRSVVAWILLQLAAGVLIIGVFTLVLVGFIAALAAGGSDWGGYLVVILVLLLGFGLVLAWLGTKFVFTVPTIALEGRPVFAAAAQSWRLTSGAFWRTFGTVLLVQVLFGFAVSIASVPLTIGAALVRGAFDPLGQADVSSGAAVGATVAIVVGSLLGIAVQCVTDVLTASVITFLAIDRRIRTEALDQRIASHLETGDPLDPFAPGPRVARPPWPGAQQQWTGAQQWPAAQQQWPGAQQWSGAPQWPGQPAAPQWPGVQGPDQQGLGQPPHGSDVSPGRYPPRDPS